MGYARNTVGFHVWVPTHNGKGKIIETKHVTFAESICGWDSLKPSSDAWVDIDLLENDEEFFDAMEILDENNSSDPDNKVVSLPDERPVQTRTGMPKRPRAGSSDSPHPVKVQPPRGAKMKPSFPLRLNTKWGQVEVGASRVGLGQERPGSVNSVVELPITVHEAISSPNAEKWRAAMDDEMDSLYRQEVWTVVPEPEDRRIVGNRWMFATKTNAHGEVVRCKARLVAQGFSQIPGVDFNETYAPVAPLNSVRFLVALANYKLWSLQLVDVKLPIYMANLMKLFL